VFYFDGNGNIFASSTVGGPPNIIVGTYTANGDCSITITLKDAFSTSTPAPAAVSFTGLLAGGGTSINLYPTAQLTPPAGTNATTTALLVLYRIPAQQACSAATLTGPYALVGTGFTSSNVSTAFLARILFDGTGKLLDGTTTGVTTPLSSLQYIGTYTVNGDCTGTLTMKPSGPSVTPASGGTSTGTSSTTSTTSITATFVITNPIVQVNSTGSVAFQSPFGLRPSLIFSLASQTQVVTGTGTAQ
jgi:hypothetical protein